MEIYSRTDIDKERAQISKASKLHWVHWVVVVLSLVITIGAWRFSKQQIHEKIEAQFSREADQVIALISERMRKYEDGLWGGVAAIQAQGGDISFSNWRTFANSLQLDEKYPGISGIGVIHFVSADHLAPYLAEQRLDRPGYDIHPDHDEGEYWPITYIEPEGVNAKAVGLDMVHETNRLTASKRARDTGIAQITGPITLVQDAGKTAGFLFFAPFYDGGVYESSEDRLSHFTGLVYAPFVVKKLMEGTLEKSRRNVGVSISDGDETIYDEHTNAELDFDINPLFKKIYTIEMYGRTWVFNIWSAKSFREAASSDQPLVILLSGIFIDTLLLVLFIGLTRSNRRAIDFADRMTSELLHRKNQLEKSNKELEQFAYVASHDLKAPLRAIHNLSSWIYEDALEVLPEDSKKHLVQLNQRADRMESLLSDLLQYSRLGKDDSDVETIHTQELVEEIIEMISPSDGFAIEAVSDLPLIVSQRAPIHQVFLNLIGNAVKHNDKPDGRVIISWQDQGEVVAFSITDNGPGIPEEFHERVFQLFQTLKPRDEVEGSGMGLAIVQKLVKYHGGSISLHSIEGAGTTFIFTWPKEAKVVKEPILA